MTNQSKIVINSLLDSNQSIDWSINHKSIINQSIINQFYLTTDWLVRMTNKPITNRFFTRLNQSINQSKNHISYLSNKYDQSIIVIDPSNDWSIINQTIDRSIDQSSINQKNSISYLINKFDQSIIVIDPIDQLTNQSTINFTWLQTDW